MDDRTIFFSHLLVQTCLGRLLWHKDEASAMLTSYDDTQDAAQRDGYPISQKRFAALLIRAILV